MRKRKDNILDTWNSNSRDFNQKSYLTAKGFYLWWENELGVAVHPTPVQTWGNTQLMLRPDVCWEQCH